jgi:hypothetical protein
MTGSDARCVVSQTWADGTQGNPGNPSEALVVVQRVAIVVAPRSLAGMVPPVGPRGLGGENCGRIRRAERVSGAGSVRSGPLATGPGGSCFIWAASPYLSRQ